MKFDKDKGILEQSGHFATKTPGFNISQIVRYDTYGIRDDSRLAPSQWETSLQSNAVSHSSWLGANLESALGIIASTHPHPLLTSHTPPLHLQFALGLLRLGPDVPHRKFHIFQFIQVPSSPEVIPRDRCVCVSGTRSWRPTAVERTEKIYSSGAL